ncbi:MAG: lysophospholipid acyltransferase family protein [Bacteroidota bacterium]
MPQAIRGFDRPSEITYVDEMDPWWRRWIIFLLEVVTGQPRIQRLYNQIQSMDIVPVEVWGKALELLEVNVDYDQTQLEKIPDDGPLVFIANHPFGVLDGLILGYLTGLVRQEYVFLVNEVLVRQDPRLKQFLLPITFQETKAAMRINIQTRQEAVKRLLSGEALVIFPAGGVATAEKGWGPAVDLEWKRFTAKVIQQSKATVVPIYFHGQNSRIFQLVSQWSPTLRLGLLVHELRNKIGKTFRIEIGDPITYESLAEIKDRQALIDHLRDQTFALKPTSKKRRPS